MSRDPLEGVRPGDSDRPSFATSAPGSPTPVIAPGSTTRGGGKALVFVAVGACVALGAVAAVFFQGDASQGPVATPTVAPSPTATTAPGAASESATDAGIRQLARHSPDGSSETPPADTMTATPPKAKP